MKMKLQDVEHWLWYFFLATLAWQTRIIFWQADSSFIEWRAMFLYGSDVALLALFGFAVVRGWRPHVRGFDALLIALFAAALFSLIKADQIVVGIYQCLKLAQFMFLYLYVRQWAVRHFDTDTSALWFVVGALGQAFLGLTQYVLQHDVGIRWLGETLLTTDMHGVAVFYDLAHTKILRAYGTLPHPNILAAYLMFATWALGWLYLRHGTRKDWQHRLVWVTSGTLLVLALYATYSRTMIVAWLGASMFIIGSVLWPKISSHWTNISIVRQRMRHIFAVIVFVSLFFTVVELPRIQARMSISSGDEAVRLRVMYNKDAIASGHNWALNVNWTGVGIGNFTSWLATYDSSLPAFMYQPAHNVFLLVYSELGILGLLVWVIWIGALLSGLRHAHPDQLFVRWSLFAIMGAIVFIAMFDHFFWTLQQGRILLWIALAIVSTNQYDEFHV